MHWPRILTLLALWLAAPPVAALLGYAGGKAFASLTRVGPALVAVGWLALARRRRSERKYEGLRILR